MPNNFSSFGDIMQKRPDRVKPPAYPWQDLALRIIKELSVPNFKRSSVFKVCKENSESVIQQALIDTRELCTEGQCWKYFFKIISELGKPRL